MAASPQRNPGKCGVGGVATLRRSDLYCCYCVERLGVMRRVHMRLKVALRTRSLGAWRAALGKTCYGVTVRADILLTAAVSYALP